MTGNISYLSDFEEINEGYVAFGGNPKGGKIIRKGKIKTGKLDFDDVYFVKELKFKLFSVSQMCDKKNSVLFTDTECVVFSFNFKLLDDNHVLLRVPRENNMYNVDLKNIVPSGDLTCLFAKATLDESNLWHRRLGYINFKTMNKLIKGHLVRGLPSKVFKNNHTCVACKKGKQHSASRFVRPFGCPVTILNILDPLGKFDGKADEGFLVRYSISSKAFRAFNSRTRIVQETLHISFLENQPNVAGSGPTWLFDIDTLTQFMNYQPVVAGNQPTHNVGIQENLNTGTFGKEAKFVQQYMLLPLWSSGLTDAHNIDVDDAYDDKEPESEVHVSLSSIDKTKKHDDKEKREAQGKSAVEFAPVTAVRPNLTNNTNSFNVAGPSNTTVKIVYSDNEEDVGAEADFSNLETTPQTRSMARMVKEQEPKRVHQTLKDPSWIKAMQEELLQFKMQKVWVLVDLPKGKRGVGFKWVFRNKKDERGIVVRNKARLVAQVHTQEEGIDYEEVFAPVVSIEAIRLFLAYASFMGFILYQMDVKSAFLYETIEEEVYVCQPPGFEDPDYPDKVYVDDIIFRSTNKELCQAFEKLMKDKFQISAMGELTFILGLQVKQKEDGIFISQDKYVAEILRKFGLTNGKSASNPIDTEKPLLKDPDGEHVDVHIYRSMIGSLMYLTSSRSDIMFVICACARFQVTPKVSDLHAVKRIFRYLKGKPHLGLLYPKDSPFNLVAYSDSDYAGASLDRKSTTGGCRFLGYRLISWQCKKQTVVATSSIEAEYVAAASCCA
uniref:Putative ribonuclease H-like domain-containing protein n=1 Tax=Tanacetum cinerariifolium TaxID=118510 RepID=A0A699H0K2_TANCI|nr:putative ribonuclease H-like domain-containing protein [Tanacetum cinerariifolium]